MDKDEKPKKKMSFKDMKKDEKVVSAILIMVSSILVAAVLALVIYYFVRPAISGYIDGPVESDDPINPGSCLTRFCHAQDKAHNYLFMVLYGTRIQYLSQSSNYQVDAIGVGVSYNMVGLRQIENQCDVFRIYPIGYRSEQAMMKENQHDPGTFYLALVADVNPEDEIYTHFKWEYDSTTNRYSLFNVGTNSYIELRDDILSVDPYFYTEEDNTTKHAIFQCMSCEECEE